LEQVFSDFSYAGLDGVELMEGQLRHDDAVQRIKQYVSSYGVSVTGSSYGVGFSMWEKKQHKKILSDIALVVPRLAEVGGTTFGISVGNKKNNLKTEAELDAQAELLLKIRESCRAYGIQANLHNHTYEVSNKMHDLRGTMKRIPDFKLGPDLNWLIRAEIDPVAFIDEFGPKLVYLHIRDQYENGIWTEYVGQGATDFKNIAAALQRQKFQGRAAIELAFPNDFTPKYSLKKDWKKSKQFVQRTFGWS
jgi:sugar phosphate isomerase/epimerase